jgi:3',5'-cyclic AMP phosphodiesterase CpdA
MKIGFFTDPHYANLEIAVRTRKPLLSLGKIKAAMDAFAAAGVGMVICLGDIIDDCGDRSVNLEFSKRTAELIHSYGIEFHLIPGNHDGAEYKKASLPKFSESGCRRTPSAPENTDLIFLDANFNREEKSYDDIKIDWTDCYVPAWEVEFLKKRAEIKRRPEYLGAPRTSALTPI